MASEARDEEVQSSQTIENNLVALRIEVRDAQARRPEHITDDVCIMAVSKTVSLEDITLAYENGCRNFGENYVQELCEKSLNAELLADCPEIKWHFIGHLQSNKVNKLVCTRNLYMVECVDSVKLANNLNTTWAKMPNATGLKVKIQVNTSEEKSKSGIRFCDVENLVKHIIENCPHLEFTGFMTIGSPGVDITSGPNPEYVALVKYRDEICEKFGFEKLELSMGMSQDFQHAIELGSTCVRVGQRIFGRRAKKFVPQLTNP